MTNKKSGYTPKIFTPVNRSEHSGDLLQALSPMLSSAATSADSKRCWRWGSDNLLPYAFAQIARNSTTHRRIIKDKADYIAGKGFAFDTTKRQLAALVECANGTGETLRQVLYKCAMDHCMFGNSFIEIVTDPQRGFVSLFHQDASRCRLARDGKNVLLHHNWRQFTEDDLRSLPVYPRFGKGEDGCLHSVYHYKDYEPSFSHYGVPTYIAGLNVCAIAYKTDRWNISRLDNSFQLSGVMMLDAGVDTDEQAQEIVRKAERKFAGNPGQVMFMLKDCGENDASRYIPIATSNEGDWHNLHDQAMSDIVVAHSWFRTLSGLDYSSGFSAERIQHEYEVALNTVILSRQAELLEPLKDIIALLSDEDTSSLAIVNHPPMRAKQNYMRVWEARRADGLDYDSEDPSQQIFLAELGK